jgi:DNA invertase Pin-like site-specific DNA recombinase
MYVRMSSTPQDQSIEHQCARLNEYAEDHGIEVVKMYADAGKSGLRINGRDGLQELMDDVQARNTDFEMVLVYDVSRWGRFQDTDEGAHYEYLCRQAGIQVVYCAEPFQNDGSAVASILKGMKRTMAAEYSRELSAKVFAAQCRFASNGFKMGGFVGYGLRRVSYDRDGQPRRTLESGERKVAATDRVRFGWGPPHEVDVVRRIYTWYLDGHYGDTEIASMLNKEKVQAERAGPWKPWHVKSILTNQKYMGKILFNRGRAKLSSPRELNPCDEWISVDGMLPPIISPEVFQKAGEERKRRMLPKDREALLGMLRALHEKYGRVTINIINAEKGVPNCKYFSNRFGSIADAYVAAGIPTGKTLLYARTKRAVRQMLHLSMSEVRSMIERAGAQCMSCAHKWSVLINDRVVLKVVISRSRHDKDGRIRWRIPMHTSPLANFVLCVQMDTANIGVLNYYLLPLADFREGHIILRHECLDDRAQYRHATLAHVFGLSSATSVTL